MIVVIVNQFANGVLYRLKAGQSKPLLETPGAIVAPFPDQSNAKTRCMAKTRCTAPEHLLGRDPSAARHGTQDERLSVWQGLSTANDSGWRKRHDSRTWPKAIAQYASRAQTDLWPIHNLLHRFCRAGPRQIGFANRALHRCHLVPVAVGESNAKFGIFAVAQQ